MKVEKLKQCILENSDELATVIAAGLHTIIEEDFFLWFTLDTEKNAIIEVCIGDDKDDIIHKIELSAVVASLMSGNDDEPMLSRFADILEGEAKRIREYLT